MENGVIMERFENLIDKLCEKKDTSDAELLEILSYEGDLDYLFKTSVERAKPVPQSWQQRPSVYLAYWNRRLIVQNEIA